MARIRGMKRTRDLIDGNFEAVKADSAPYEGGIVPRRLSPSSIFTRFQAPLCDKDRLTHLRLLPMRQMLLQASLSSVRK